jgi:tetratricopeptide (TPR) repeat protein
MAALTTDKDATAAATFLNQAHQADLSDPIVARDLARVLSSQADKTENQNRKRELWAEARDALKSAFSAGKSRSDFVCLLAQTQNKLGDYPATVQLLNTVRITVWEGSHEAHDLFVEAHLAIGRTYLAGGRPVDALAEFDGALEYPENLAIGRLENAKEDHIQRLRADALTALGRKAEAQQAREKAGK